MLIDINGIKFCKAEIILLRDGTKSKKKEDKEICILKK